MLFALLVGIGYPRHPTTPFPLPLLSKHLVHGMLLLILLCRLGRNQGERTKTSIGIERGVVATTKVAQGNHPGTRMAACITRSWNNKFQPTTPLSNLSYLSALTYQGLFAKDLMSKRLVDPRFISDHNHQVSKSDDVPNLPIYGLFKLGHQP